jgi:hypothetical protein
VDATGHLYVADSGSKSRVQVYTPDP